MQEVRYFGTPQEAGEFDFDLFLEGIGKCVHFYDHARMAYGVSFVRPFLDLENK